MDSSATANVRAAPRHRALRNARGEQYCRGARHVRCSDSSSAESLGTGGCRCWARRPGPGRDCHRPCSSVLRETLLREEETEGGWVQTSDVQPRVRCQVKHSHAKPDYMGENLS